MDEQTLKKAIEKQSEIMRLSGIKSEAASKRHKFSETINELSLILEHRTKPAKEGHEYGIREDYDTEERIENLKKLEDAIDSLRDALYEFSGLTTEEVFEALIEYHAKRLKEAEGELEKATLDWVEALGFGAVTAKPSDY